MARVNVAFALVLGLVVTAINCVEFEDEFYQNRERQSGSGEVEPRARGGLGSLASNWHSGLFDFDSDADFFFRNVQPGASPKNPSGQIDKELSSGTADDNDREPLDIDFVSGPIGGAPVEDIDVDHHPGASFPFFPFGGFGGFPFNFNGPTHKPWWKGDNVCVEREEDITDWERPGSMGGGFSGGFSVNFETCSDMPNKHVCTTVTNVKGKKRTETVTRQCCYGYSRGRHNEYCEKIDWVPVIETAEKLGANEFIRTAKNNGLELTGNITLFVPLDAAFTDFSEHMFETNLVVLPLARNRRAATKDVSGITTKDLAMGHIVKGLVQLEEIENEQLLTTDFENATIRMNIFPKSPNDDGTPGRFKYTANCVPVTGTKLASNGVVHTVQSVLVPVTQTLLEMVQQRSDLVVFRTILEKTDLAEQLNNQDMTFTVFAPNDNAFSKLEPNIRRIVKDGNACTLNILKNHILDLTFCGATVVEKAKTNTFNILGDKMLFERQEAVAQENATESQYLIKQADIVINKLARVTEADLMATNGVLHVIDTVLETDSATPVTTLMEHQNLTIFKRLVEAAGLVDMLDAMSNVTFFVPTDKAFEQSEWKAELENNPESLKDNETLKKFLEHHIAPDYIKTCNLSEEMISTMSMAELRVNLYSTHPVFSNIMNRATVNCARLVHFDTDSCGSVMHQVDKVLEIPKKSLLELLETTEKYSKFLELVREANLTDLFTEAENQTQEYTLLVPSNEVFAEQEEWYQQLLENKVLLEQTIKSHILPDVLCCTGFVPSEWPFIRTIQTISQKSLRIDRNRRPMIGNAGITKCDVVATNGVVHEINDVIVIKESPRNPLFF